MIHFIRWASPPGGTALKKSPPANSQRLSTPARLGYALDAGGELRRRGARWARGGAHPSYMTMPRMFLPSRMSW
jgi:hypothetical protein